MGDPLTTDRVAKISAAVQAHQHPSKDTSPDVYAYALADVVPDLLAEVDRLRAEVDRLRSAGGRFHREVRDLLEETYSSHGRPLGSTHAGGIRDDLYGAANRFRRAVTGSLNGDWSAALSAEPEPPPEPRH